MFKKLRIAASVQLSAATFSQRVAVNKFFPLEYDHLQMQKGLLGMKSYKLFPCLIKRCSYNNSYRILFEHRKQKAYIKCKNINVVFMACRFFWCLLSTCLYVSAPSL